MGFLLAVFVFTAVSLTAAHFSHLDHQNAELNQTVQTLETEEDGNSLEMDGLPVRNLSDESAS